MGSPFSRWDEGVVISEVPWFPSPHWARIIARRVEDDLPRSSQMSMSK